MVYVLQFENHFSLFDGTCRDQFHSFENDLNLALGLAVQKLD